MSPVDFLASLFLAALAIFIAWHLLILAIAVVVAPFYWAYRLIRFIVRTAWRVVVMALRFGLWITRRLSRPKNAERVVIDFQAERRRRSKGARHVAR